MLAKSVITTALMRKSIRAYANAEIASHSTRFFKSGPGEYAEGDKFLGVRVPVIRTLIKKFKTCTLASLKPLLHSRFHEERLFAVLMLAEWCKRTTPAEHESLYNFYLANRAYINNWDLVDGSASYVVGGWLHSRDRSILYSLAKSDKLWDRRIAMLATLDFIKRKDFDDTLKLAAILLRDPHDLMHKAVGWMLREVAKRDFERADTFLVKHYAQMPRTMLRYAIERYPEERRQAYLKGHV